MATRQSAKAADEQVRKQIFGRREYVRVSTAQVATLINASAPCKVIFRRKPESEAELNRVMNEFLDCITRNLRAR